MALLRDVFGDDWWPYGIEPNRHVIEALTRYMGEQGLLGDNIPTVEELFAPTLLGDYRL
jgi:4,5-dihydroxyphthalate decarboxylase